MRSAHPSRGADRILLTVKIEIPVSALRRFHAGMTVLWLVLAVPSILWWKDSILWVIVLSVWANVASHFSGWQGARAEDAAGS
jgi:hypothetical protein